jgi:hypothetical protein
LLVTEARISPSGLKANLVSEWEIWPLVVGLHLFLSTHTGCLSMYFVVFNSFSVDVFFEVAMPGAHIKRFKTKNKIDFFKKLINIYTIVGGKP